MQLAIKYQIDWIRTRIVEQFEADWPKTIFEWRRQRGEWKANLTSMAMRIEPLYPLEHFHAEPAAAIRFALDFDIPSILPAAYYRLAMADLEEQWKDPEPVTLDPEGVSARWGCLDAGILMRLMRGKERLMEKYFRISGDLRLSLGGRGCRSEGCRQKGRELEEVMMTNWQMNLRLKPDVLGILCSI